MRTWDPTAFQGLIDAGVPEGASLEFKSELPLHSDKAKSEAAKDLASMGNAGGGTVLFGIDEDTNDWPVATAVTPLTDPSLLSKLENILQDGVKPPLVVSFTRVDVSGGYVLVAEVERSSLGPYMVELRGDRRFHIRDGQRIRAMTEAEVSAAYALAARGADRRAQTWGSHDLPITPPNGAVWLTISGLPQEPLTEVIDLATVDPEDLLPPAAPTVYLNEWSLADMTDLFSSMTRWSDGFHAEAVAGPSGQLARQIRIHRNGAVGLALQIQPNGDDGPVSLTRVSRILNGSLMYLGWLWDHLGVRRPVELRLRMRRCDVVPFQIDNYDPRMIVQPPDVLVDSVELDDLLLVGALMRAGRRHLLCRRFADRAAQAFGHRDVKYPYRRGELYGQNGEPLNMAASEREIYVDNTHAATIYEGGLVVCGSTAQPVGSFIDGVLTDDEGHVLGLLELAPGATCPDDFVAVSLREDPSGAVHQKLNGDRDTFTLPTDMAAQTQVWSSKDARVHIRGH